MEHHKDLFICWAGTATAVATSDLSASISIVTSILTMTFTGIRLYHEIKARKK